MTSQMVLDHLAVDEIMNTYLEKIPQLSTFSTYGSRSQSMDPIGHNLCAQVKIQARTSQRDHIGKVRITKCKCTKTRSDDGKETDSPSIVCSSLLSLK